MAAKVADEAMTISISMDPKEYDVYEERIKNFNSIVIGPGLGKSENSKVLKKPLARIL